jgi:hypothetical protein
MLTHAASQPPFWVKSVLIGVLLFFGESVWTPLFAQESGASIRGGRVVRLFAEPRGSSAATQIPLESSESPALRESPVSRWVEQSKKKPRLQASETVWVMRSDEGLSCEPASGISLEQGAWVLKHAKITIFDQKKGTDGKMHTQVCGAIRGTTNCYLLERSQLKQALDLGFEPQSSVDSVSDGA